jgi:drug/metabolite transporter (DMT)-like permease
MSLHGILNFQKIKSLSIKRSKKIAYFCLAVTCIVWGTTWVGSRYAVQQKVPGLEVSYLRQFIAGSLVLLFFLFKREKMPTWPQFKWLAMVAFFMFFLNNGMATWGVNYISSGLASLIAAMFPLCMVLLDFVIYKKRDGNKLTFIGLVVGIIGVGYVFYENAFTSQPAGYGFGVMLCFIAMLGWALGSLFIARNKYAMNPYYAAGWQMFLASIMIFLMSEITGNHIPVSQVPARVWEDISFLSIGGSILTFIAFIYSLKHLPPAIASLYAYINPMVAMLVGAEVLHEALTTNLIIGAVITLAGVYLVNYSLRKEPTD